MIKRSLDSQLMSRRSPSTSNPLARLVPALRPRHPWLLASIPGLIVCAAVWMLLAPPQLSGSTSYVVTDGTSMLPKFHAGDLVLLRREPSYHVGEVAGYHNAQLGVTVMHRIVAIHGDHYIFKGDNNSWTDTYHPTRAQIVGADWLHLPGWGNVLLHLRTPVIAGVILGLLWLFIVWPRSTTRRQRRRRRHAH